MNFLSIRMMNLLAIPTALCGDCVDYASIPLMCRPRITTAVGVHYVLTTLTRTMMQDSSRPPSAIKLRPDASMKMRRVMTLQLVLNARQQ